MTKTKSRATWTPRDAGFIADMGGDVSIYAMPEHSAHGKPRRGTRWRIGATLWTEATRTASIFGRDAWRELYPNKREAMLAAEALYAEARG